MGYKEFCEAFSEASREMGNAEANRMVDEGNFPCFGDDEE